MWFWWNSVFQSAQAKCAFELLILRLLFFFGVESLIPHHCHCPHHCFFTQIVTQMSLLKGAVPRAGQTFHQGLILAFIPFLSYFPARLSALQLWAGIFFLQMFFLLVVSHVPCFCCLFSVARFGFCSALGAGMLWQLLGVPGTCQGRARLLLPMGFSLPSAQCCSQGVRTGSEPSEPCVLPGPPAVLLLRGPLLSPPGCGWARPVSPRGEELRGTRGHKRAAPGGSERRLAWLEETPAGTSWPGALSISPQQSSRKLLQTAAGSHPFYILTTGWKMICGACSWKGLKMRRTLLQEDLNLYLKEYIFTIPSCSPHDRFQRLCIQKSQIII